MHFPARKAISALDVVASGLVSSVPEDMTFRHGGDFEGLRQKLYYIKGLGCNAVWISPIFQPFDSYRKWVQTSRKASRLSRRIDFDVI